MATFNQAADFVVLSSGTSYNLSPGSPQTASTVWRIYCVSAGTITIGSLNSTVQATLPMAQSAVIDMQVSYASVASGSFLAIKSVWQPEYNGSQPQISG